MKNTVLKIFLLMGFGVLTTCQQPDDLTPPVSRKGLNSITVSFYHGEGEFTVETPDDGFDLVIPVPYYYPESSENQVTDDSLKRMRVRANLDDNVTINPPLLIMDLTQTNVITITNQRKESVQYTLRGEIRKSSACAIEDFSIPSLGVSGIVNETTKTISLPNFEAEEPVLANIRLSWHATVSPDPGTTAFSYDEDLELTVTAHDGVTQSVYTVKKEVPDKLPLGIRPGSAKIMFAMKLKADLGVTVDHFTTGIAATGDYVIINTRNQNSVYIDAKTGEKKGEIDLGDVKGNLTNFYTTADAAGNVVICNLAGEFPGATFEPVFKVWRLTSIAGATELFIEWTPEASIGRKLSINGNIDGNAIITAPLYMSPANSKFARWTVVDGVLTSQTPEIITIGGGHAGWTTNCDIMYTSATSLSSDYFAAAYSNNILSWVSGASDQISKSLNRTIPDDGNWITNALDYVEFNKAKFAALNWINSFTWGSSDIIWLMDVSTDATFTGNLSFQSESSPAIIWISERNAYGPRGSGFASPESENANGAGDVALRVSPDGYYLYLYFMFCNGFVVGVQFDCIDM